jgi:thiol-disulfide isomerase/thioredoxin
MGGASLPSQRLKIQRPATSARARVDGVAGWTGVFIVAGVLAVASGGGLFMRARNGKFHAGTPTPATRLDPVLAALGVTADTPVTLLQFSSAFCAPCRTTRVLCADVADNVPGVRHLEVDAESHLDAVRALEIWRTPTVLIIDGEGQIVRRASGAPTRAQLLGAVGDLLPRSDVGASGQSR